MKSIALICVFLVGAHALTKEQYEPLMKKLQAIGNQCVEKEHATSGDLAKLIAFEIPPSSHGAKCILACVYEHFNAMNEDGNIDKQAAINAFHEIKSLDAELHGKIVTIIDSCYEKREIVDDRCETASLMATCIKQEADAMGILKEAFLVSD